MQRGDLAGALRAYDTAIGLDPDVFFFPIGRCDALLRFRAIPLARQGTDRLVQRFGGERANQLRRRWLMEVGEHQQALALIEHEETQRPGARPSFEKAYVLFNLGR